MPNHTSNVLRISYYDDDGSVVKKIADEIKSGENLFDFNKFIPYPEKFQVLDSASEEYRKNNPDDWKNCPRDGYNQGGYEWCCSNWGTKWNSYDHQVRTKTEWCYAIYFETAWTWPEPIIRAFMDKYPEVDIDLISACEGGFFAIHLSRADGITKLVEWDSKNDEVIEAIREGIRS